MRGQQMLGPYIPFPCLPPAPVHNAAQIVFAVLGFIGVGSFLLSLLLASGNPKTVSARYGRIALLLGLASWLGLVVLRHDVVAATGLVVAMALLWRFFRAQL